MGGVVHGLDDGALGFEVGARGAGEDDEGVFLRGEDGGDDVGGEGGASSRDGDGDHFG